MFLMDGSGTAASIEPGIPASRRFRAADRDYFRALQGGNATSALGGHVAGQNRRPASTSTWRIRRTGTNRCLRWRHPREPSQSFFTDFWQALVPAT